MSKPRLKVRCLKGIATSHITQMQAALLTCFVETYLPLNQAEQAEFEQLIQKEEVSVMEFITSWERKGRAEGIEKGRVEGIEKGRAEGIEKGRAEEARETLLVLLREKFGAVPGTTLQRVEAIASVEELRRLLRQIIHANSLAEIGLDGLKE
jgi:flagellar biosynthesis/type III secretory pathway protein FliH